MVDRLARRLEFDSADWRVDCLAAKTVANAAEMWAFEMAVILVEETVPSKAGL